MACAAALEADKDALLWSLGWKVFVLSLEPQDRWMSLFPLGIWVFCESYDTAKCISCLTKLT